MSHFTVLTAVHLPEDFQEEVRLVPDQQAIIRLKEEVSLARILDKTVPEVPEHPCVSPQMRFEVFIEGLVADRLAPYDENLEGNEYLEFVDCTEECRQEYEHDTRDCVRFPNGSIVPTYSRAFTSDYEVYEGNIYKKRFGQLRHRHRTEKAKRMKLLPAYPLKKLYPTFEAFAENYHGYYLDETSHAWGYYTNTNAKWDWFQIGGRWPERFLVAEDCRTAVLGERSFLSDQLSSSAPAGYRWVAGARKCDIAWDVMKKWYIDLATTRFYQLEKWYREGQIPSEEHLLRITDTGIKDWCYTAYAKGETVEEYLSRNGLSGKEHYPLSTYAYLGDDGWFGSGDMGWFGLSSNDKDEREWNQMVENFIAALPDETMLVSVDCHI